MKLIFLFVFLGLFSCQREESTIRENDDYVLVEFAAKLEEEQEQFKKLEETSPTGP